jgi:hypothetical protein
MTFKCSKATCRALLWCMIRSCQVPGTATDQPTAHTLTPNDAMQKQDIRFHACGRHKGSSAIESMRLNQVLLTSVQEVHVNACRSMQARRSCLRQRTNKFQRPGVTSYGTHSNGCMHASSYDKSGTDNQENCQFRAEQCEHQARSCKPSPWHMNNNNRCTPDAEHALASMLGTNAVAGCRVKQCP